MEAYELKQDFTGMTEAEVDRVPMQFDPLGRWQLETGGGAKVPEEWFKAWPTKAIVAPSEKPITPWLGAGSYCVNEDVKRVIESLAPDVHQFIPLTVEAGPVTDRRTYQYYSLHIADRADEVIKERSEGEWITSLADKKILVQVEQQTCRSARCFNHRQAPLAQSSVHDERHVR